MNVTLPSAWRNKRYHISYLLAWLSAGLLLGIFLGQFIRPSYVVLWLVILAIFIFVSLWSRRWYACIIIAIAGIGFGVLRGSIFFQEISLLDGLAGQKIVLSGNISQDPVLSNGSNVWRTQLKDIQVSDTKNQGEVYATVISDQTLKRGDSIKISGKARDGFGNFRLSIYRSELIDLKRPADPFLDIRDKFAEGVKRVVPEPEASLGLGFLVGQKSALSDDLTEQLKIVGLTHVVVASGYNLTILVRFARKLLARRSRYLALAGSLTLVAGFVFISGFSPSMNRAAVVTLLTLLAWYYGRKFHPVQLIAYVAAGSALFYPPYVWGDLGWILSFAAFSGVLVAAPLFSKLIYRRKEPGAFMRLVIETLSAEVMTLPIIIASFGYLPVLALVANLLVAPVIPFAMLFTFVAGTIGLVAPFLAVLAMPASIVIAYVVTIVETLSAPAWAKLELVLPMGAIVAGFFCLAGFLFVIWRRQRVDLTQVSVIE